MVTIYQGVYSGKTDLSRRRTSLAGRDKILSLSKGHRSWSAERGSYLRSNPSGLLKVEP